MPYGSRRPRPVAGGKEFGDILGQMVSIVSKASRPNRPSRSPPLSDQERHLSSTQAAGPAGESFSP